MLSITDLMDFIDLDIETVHIVNAVLQLPVDESAVLARQFLATEKGILVLHHMFRDQISEAAASSPRADELRRAYAYFGRKYPLPELRCPDSFRQ